MHAANDIQGRIVALVKSILEQNAITAEIAADTKLVDASGIYRLASPPCANCDARRWSDCLRLDPKAMDLI